MPVQRLTDAQIVAATTGGQSISAAGWDLTRMSRLEDGRMALAWGTDLNAATHALNIATVDAQGTTPSAPVIADTIGSSKYLEQPKIAATAGGGFVAVWNSDYDTPSSPTAGDTYGRAFGVSGAPVGDKTALSTASGGGEFTPSVVRLGNGNILSLWSDTRATSGLTTSTDIMGRVFTPSGAAVTGEAVINSVTAGLQFGTDAAGLGDGRAVAIWATGTASLSGIKTTGIKGRFISATGAASGVEFSVDTIAAGRSYENKFLDVLALGNGGFVALWEEDSGTVEEIHFQRFTATGAKAGVETIVESVSGARHILHFFATETANGGFAAGWRLTGGGLPEAHYVRAFAMNGVEIGSEASLETLGGVGGLTKFYDMELMADGNVMMFGFKGTDAVATQVFDFGAKTLSGTTAADTLYGHHGVDDKINGGASADKLFGLSGHDQISGGAGNDILSGGGGRDTFVFDAALSASANLDRISDFVGADDEIHLDNAIFSGLGAGAGLLDAAAFYASATGKAHDADDRIVYNTTTGTLSYDADGNGAKAAVAFAVLVTKPALTAGDFVVV